jgi:NAD(P)-dependent dehydrogenase (short-subunit alcohol dehydrogenase family)
MNFNGKAIVITGGAGGVGSAAAEAFAQRGGRVMVVDRNLEAAERVAAKIRGKGQTCVAQRADVSKAAEVERYVESAMREFGAIDCFLNNAGIYGKAQNIVSHDEKDFDAVLEVNTKGVFLGLKYVLRVMEKQGHGAVVNTSSTSAFLVGLGISAYVASKAAVLGLTAAAAAEVARHGIRVNAICPGSIQTEMLETAKREAGVQDSRAADIRYQAAIPTGRYTTPEEVANLAMFLCSDLSGNITGQYHVIDGGRTVVSTVITPAQ